MAPEKLTNEWFHDRIIQALVPHSARLGVFTEEDLKNGFITEQHAETLREAKEHMDRALDLLGGSRIRRETETKAEEIKAVIEGVEEEPV